jgi:signal transduction histidine kinase/CheY-like chemotaxis protein/HPt (histidine-containing phosphotransfer) domain-containing protein
VSLKETLRTDGKQLLFVCAAFLIMALVSYFYASSVVKRQVDLYSRSEMQVYQTSIRSLILAHEAALRHAAASIAASIQKGAGPDELQELLKTWTGVFRDQKDIRNVFVSVYGYLDGNYLDGTSWIPGEFYYPKTAPWMRGALVQSGIFHSKPYIDPRTGDAVSAVSMVLFDANGESHGVLAIDYYLTPIIAQVSDYKVADTGYGILLDDSFNVLTYPESEYIGQHISALPGYQAVYEKLQNLSEGVLIDTIDTSGVENIGFFSPLENGWYLGIIAPVRYYYSEVFDMIPVITVLSLTLTLILCYLLISLSAAKTRSEEESRSKSSFLARMSHEIRTPMNTIIGLSELAAREYGRPQVRGYIEDVRKAGANLLTIINDLLDFSKIESGHLTIVPGRYSSASLFNDVLAIIRLRLHDRYQPVVFTVDLDPAIPAFMTGDEARLRQVILNLLSNAVKYTEEGFIRFTARGRRLGREVLLTFEIADSGIGIRREDLGRLFGEFSRVDLVRNQNIEGSGLGLVITRSLCRAMGGDVAVASEYGRGSVFTATLLQGCDEYEPLGELDYNPVVRPETTAGAGFVAPDFRVLIVDDVSSNLKVCEGLLAPFGMQVETCLSGEAAVALIQARGYDLVFMDHMMPGMDGLEAAAAIRALDGPVFKMLTIVALTANAVSGMKEMFLKNGFNDFLPKPIETQKLHDLLERWVPPARRRIGPAPEPGGAADAGPAPAIEGLDAAAGLAQVGGRAGRYREVLELYGQSAPSRLELLRVSDSLDLSSITAQAHALKGASAAIGAGALALKAGRLEEAGRRGDLQFIRENLGAFRDDLSALAERIRLELDQTKPAGEPAVPDEVLSALKLALETEDLDALDEMLERLSRAAGDSGEGGAISRILELSLKSEFAEAASVLDGLIRKRKV